MKYSLYILFFSLIVNKIYAQQYTLEWENILGYGYSNWGNKIIETRDGNFVMVGIKVSKSKKHSCWVMKIDTQGNSIWQKSFSTPSFDWANSVVETLKNNLLVIGTTNENNNHNILLLKINELGELLWQKQIGTPHLKEGATHSIINKNNEIILVGYQEYDLGKRKINIFKIDQNGLIIWNKHFEREFWNLGTSIQQNHPTSYIIGCYSHGEKKGVSKLFLLVLDQDGNIKWEKNIPLFGWSEIRSIYVKENGDILLTGLTDDFVTNKSSILLVLLDPDGNIKKQNIISYSDVSSWGTSILTNSAGFYVLASTAILKNKSADIFFTLLDKNLDEISSEQLGDRQWNESYNLINTSDNGVVLLGTSLETQNMYQNAKVWKFQWTKDDEQETESIDLTDTDVSTLDVGQKVILEKVQFTKGSFILASDAESELERLGKIMLEHKNIKIELSGHTSIEGPHQKNMVLSRRRLEVVKNYLITRMDIEENRIITQAFGETKPICSKDEETCQSKNRRVELKILHY